MRTKNSNRKRRPPLFIETSIQHLLPSGEGVGLFDLQIARQATATEAATQTMLRPVHVHGVLPGEIVSVRVQKRKRGTFYASLQSVLKKSEHRRDPRDIHYLSSSPFQVVTDSFQQELKVKIARDIFLQKAGMLPTENVTLQSSPESWHYRNKMEWSFSRDESGQLSTALHERGKKRRFYCSNSASIAKEPINEVTEVILESLRARTIQPEILKSLIVRYSYKTEKCVAALFVKEMDFPIFSVSHPQLAGWIIVFSDPRSPASLATQTLFQEGDDFLVENIAGFSLKYFYDNFFQINPPAFENLLTYLKEKMLPGKSLLDLYSGVGTIGFCLSSYFEKITSLEFDARATEAAAYNQTLNRLENISLLNSAAEKHDLLTLMASCDTLIVDPPRSGLHPKVIESILTALPEQFVYVSCNPVTQAEDFSKLQEKYTATSWKLFDFYPQTPHLESVLILKRK